MKSCHQVLSSTESKIVDSDYYKFKLLPSHRTNYDMRTAAKASKQSLIPFSLIKNCLRNMPAEATTNLSKHVLIFKN